MPRLVDSFARTDLVVAAINDVLAEHGIPGLTMRRIAAAAHLSPAALSDHYGNRERMLTVVGHVTGVERLRQLGTRAPYEGVGAFLPKDDDDLVNTRAWLGWCELARSAEWLTETVQEARDNEFHLLARVVDHQLTRPELDTLWALIEGLRVAVCEPVRPLPRPRAAEILERWTMPARPAA